MFQINENYLKLPGSYLFSTIGRKVKEYSAAHPDRELIRLGIGDVTLPLAPAVIETLHAAVDEMRRLLRDTPPSLVMNFSVRRLWSMIIRGAGPISG